MEQRVKPHWGWLLLAPVLLITGVVAFVVIVVAGTTQIAEGMQRVNVPGEGAVHFEKPGEYTIFYEQKGVMQAEIPTGLRVEVRPDGEDEPLKHIQPGGKFTYKNNEVAGRNFGRVSVPEAGDYHVRTSVADGVPASGRVAIGSDPSSKLLGTIFGGLGMLFGGILLCLVYMLVILVLRIRNKKKLTRPSHSVPATSAPTDTPYGSNV